MKQGHSITKFIIILQILLVFLKGWDYKQQGKDWTEGVCSSGQLQSPIDIGLNEAICQNELEITFEYNDQDFSDLQINYPTSSNTETSINTNIHWSTITINDLNSSKQWVYVANKIEIRNQSEHTILSSNFDVELQIHHTLQGGADTTEEATNMMIKENLILSFTFLLNTNQQYQDYLALQKDNPNTIFHELFFDMARIEESPYMAINPKNIMQDKFNYLEKQYFYYEGSQTQPPCTENVTWIIWVEPLYIIEEQLDAIKSYFMDNNDFADGNGNNRYTQEKNDRPVWVGGYKCFTSYPQQAYVEPGTKYDNNMGIILKLAQSVLFTSFILLM